MGLLVPTSGSIEIDNIALDKYLLRMWQKNIAHVPQSILLTDNSILENIAFGVSKENIDYKRARNCAKKAQIDSLIMNWPEKYDTDVEKEGKAVEVNAKE